MCLCLWFSLCLLLDLGGLRVGLFPIVCCVFCLWLRFLFASLCCGGFSGCLTWFLPYVRFDLLTCISLLVVYGYYFGFMVFVGLFGVTCVCLFPFVGFLL